MESRGEDARRRRQFQVEGFGGVSLTVVIGVWTGGTRPALEQKKTGQPQGESAPLPQRTRPCFGNLLASGWLNVALANSMLTTAYMYGVTLGTSSTYEVLRAEETLTSNRHCYWCPAPLISARLNGCESASTQLPTRCAVKCNVDLVTRRFCAGRHCNADTRLDPPNIEPTSVPRLDSGHKLTARLDSQQHHDIIADSRMCLSNSSATNQVLLDVQTDRPAPSRRDEIGLSR